MMCASQTRTKVKI